MNLPGQMVDKNFFNRDAQEVARDMLGLVLFHRPIAQGADRGIWLAARIIETEAYYLDDRASHASLGFTEKRKALFMEPGTIYMYYARGGDSFNISCRGEGNAVLVKSAMPWLGVPNREEMLARMTLLNPLPGGRARSTERMCAGQTLLCKALGLKVPRWDGLLLGADPDFALLDVGYRPASLLRTTRLGIPPGRDEHLPLRFVDEQHAAHCTRNPIRKNTVEGRDYQRLSPPGPARP